MDARLRGRDREESGGDGRRSRGNRKKMHIIMVGCIFIVGFLRPSTSSG